jgi:dCMP deaminase
LAGSIVEKEEESIGDIMADWMSRWLNMCDLVATWSKDRSTRLGAVIVDERNVVLSLGWNGFPRGIDDFVDSRHARPAKYSWTEHAERNAIYNAASKGINIQGSTLYTQSLPCPDCARAIIQSGISRVVVRDTTLNDRWAESQRLSLEMLEEAGVEMWVKGNNGT